MKKDNDCLFCKIVAEQVDSKRIYSDEHMLVIEDAYPAAEVHLLCIPKEHFANLGEFYEVDAEKAGDFVHKMTKIAKKMSPNSEYKIVFNSGPSVGQTILHLHGHIVAGENAGNF